MTWKTHFFKKYNRYNRAALSPNHSIVLASFPEDELVTLDRLINLVLANKNNEGLVCSSKEVKVLLEDLIKEKLVGELYDTKLHKIVKEHV